MSRIGRMPIPLPDGVEVTTEGRRLRVKGPLGQLERELHPEIGVAREGGDIIVTRPSEAKTHKQLHGLTRTLVNNMITGVTTGFTKNLEIIGVGWNAALDGKKLVLSVGYCNPVVMEIPSGLTGATQPLILLVQHLRSLLLLGLF